MTLQAMAENEDLIKSLYELNLQGQWAIKVYDFVHNTQAIWYDNSLHTGLFPGWPNPLDL